MSRRTERQRFHVPNLHRVLSNRSICGEHPHRARGFDTLRRPLFFVLIRCVSRGYGVQVRREIMRRQVDILTRINAIDETFKRTILWLAKDAGANHVDGTLKSPINLWRILRHRSSHSRDLIRSGAEGKHVALADGLFNLYVSAIHRSDNQTAVHDKLHVARAARLHSGGGNVLRNITRWYEHFRERNVIVRHEDHLEQIASRGVGVYHLGHRTDEHD